jgi:hypothetical protein
MHAPDNVTAKEEIMGFSHFRYRFRSWIAAVLMISFSVTFIQNIPARPPVKNSLFAIVPYKFDGLWVFDDPDVGLVKEPFISGTDRILDVLTQTMPDAYKGFRLLFSSRPFPGYTARFIWSRSEYGGNWYFWTEKEMEGCFVRRCSNTSSKFRQTCT